MSYDVNFLTGPFRSTEAKENVKQQRRVRIRPPIDHAAFRRELVDYFGRRLRKLQIIKTTVTPRGQTIDWIPIESQHPTGEIASPHARPIGSSPTVIIS